MAKKRRAKKAQAGNLDQTFQALVNGWRAAQQNYSRVAALGNLGRQGGLTQLNDVALQASNATQFLLTFVQEHPEFLQAYREQTANLRF